MEIIFPEAVNGSVRAHEASAASHRAVIVNAGADEEIKIRRRERFFVGEVSALDQTFESELENITVECAERGGFRYDFARFPGKHAHAVGDAFADELPVVNGVGVFLRIAQSERSVGAVASGNVGNGVGDGIVVLPAPLEECFALRRDFASL